MSLKELKELLQTYFINHKQVKTFDFTDIKTFVAITDKEYFAVNVDFTNGGVFNSNFNYNLSITIEDITDVNFNDSILTAQSDSLEIYKDFIAYLESKNIDYSNINVQPFQNSDGDITAGVTGTITISDYLTNNNCITPIN